jgi:hypothetical protein
MVLPDFIFRLLRSDPAKVWSDGTRRVLLIRQRRSKGAESDGSGERSPQKLSDVAPAGGRLSGIEWAWAAAPGYNVAGRQSNLLVVASKTVTPEQLKSQLIEEVRKKNLPYGLYFEDIAGGFTSVGRSVPNFFEVRLTAFNKIVAADNRSEAFNGMCGAESGNVPVSAGGYDVDDDGVTPHPRVLVDKGILKTLLRMAKQRGNDYGIVVRRMGNPLVQMALGRTRVLIISGGNGPGNINVEPLIEAYKVFPDGHEELARNLNLNSLTFGSFKDIVAVSDTASVYTAPMRMTIRSPGMMTSFVPPGGPTVVSVAIPAMLFDDMTLQRPSADVPHLPFTKHPYFDK